MNFWLLALLAPTAHAAKDSALWKVWYLVSQNGAAVSLFEETAEKRPAENELAITQKWIEKAGDRKETYIGSVSKADSLAPVAFFVERKGPKPYQVDARAKGAQLEISFKPGTPDLANSTERAPLNPGTILSSALPTAISRHFTGGKENFSFTAVVEDGGDMNVDVKKGTVDVGTTEKKVGKHLCRQATVTFDGKVQEWWVTKAGLACLVTLPSTGTKMELSTERDAMKALKELR